MFRNLKQLNYHHQHHDLNNSSTLGDLSNEEIFILTQYSYLVDALFINADGIYLATYSALLLNLKLLYLDYYNSEQKDIKRIVPMSENAFIDEIFNYHITVYLSSHFLAEIYQNILAINLFQPFLIDSDSENKEAHFLTIPLIKILHGMYLYIFIYL